MPHERSHRSTSSATLWPPPPPGTPGGTGWRRKRLRSASSIVMRAEGTNLSMASSSVTLPVALHAHSQHKPVESNGRTSAQAARGGASIKRHYYY
jgi:hypothetical protein